jgi:ADP-ribose pyrophosphatase YjhB (NUDIX family)
MVEQEQSNAIAVTGTAKHELPDPIPTGGGGNVTRLPMIWHEEVAELTAQYGEPVHRSFTVEADDYIRAYRWRTDMDRRAEVIFVIQDAAGYIWVHAKAHYPAHIFRLPSGGVHWDERIEDALHREIDEETGLSVHLQRFIGLLEYQFIYEDSSVEFASYIFLLASEGGMPKAHSSEEIALFRAALPRDIAQIAVDLRHLLGARRGWGQWRALAHDVVYEQLIL